MATNLNTTNPKRKQADSFAVYKVTAALVLLCVGIFALRALHNHYTTIGGQELLDPMRGAIVGFGFGLCAICAVVMAVWKNTVCRVILPWLVFIFAMVGVTGLSMQAEFTYGFSLLYFLWAFVLVQYIIYQLYRWEFFLFSLPTVAAGFLFYQIKSGFSMSMRNLLPLILAIVSLVCVVVFAFMASRNKGCLVFGKTRIRLFSKNYNPFLHYLVAALWIICIPAALLLGSLFSFYCMFAAIAVEFIAAVYYTFQLN